MKNTLKILVVICFLITGFANVFAQQTYAPPTYRGKIILIVDQTVAADPRVNSKIERLKEDLVGDGWRVLRHDVQRGPNLYEEGASAWAPLNAPAIRQIRALIEADYGADPSEVKSVLLIGHVATPYSGTSRAIVGNHYSGAMPADPFYGDPISPYGSPGWSDSTTAYSTSDSNIYANTPVQDINYPNDGKFDQDYVPSMKLAVGRVDFLFDAFDVSIFGVNEETMLAQYFDKNHDFRNGNFLVQRRAIDIGNLATDADPLDTVFGSANVLVDTTDPNSWFPNVNGSNGSYLLGFGGSETEGDGNPYVGYTPDFVSMDSRVVFVNLFGSFYGNWEDPSWNTDSFFRAPLANPYDPAKNQFGYGLDVLWGGTGLDVNTLTKRSLGATIGDAILPLYNSQQAIVNECLMGDPTLRMHTVRPASGLTVATTTSTATLTWTASPDAAGGYNVYSGPTKNGPFVLVNTTGPVTGTTYAVTRPAPTSGTPDNYYMVRAVKTETTPVGSYVNMSEGILGSVSPIAAYLHILANPANQGAVINAGGGIANSMAFSVDVAGCDTNGDEQLTYFWYKNGVPLYDDGGHIVGANTAGLLIKGVQSSDVGSYSVTVANASGTLSSSSATLTLDATGPAAAPDTIPVVRDTATDLSVLANDTSGGSGAMTVVSISALSNPSAGTIQINPDDQTIHFSPTQTFLGSVTFTYIMSDGAGEAQATVTLNVIPNSSDTPPTISSIGNQQMAENTELDIPFTVGDGLTPLDNLSLTVTSSSTLLSQGGLTISGSGASRVLHITANNFLAGVMTVTLTAADWDGQSTSLSFQLTVTADPTIPLTGGGTMTSANGFSFNMTAPANSQWNLYESSDLQNWTLLGAVTFDSAGAASFTDDSAANVSNRFYKLSNGSTCSQAFGFERMVVGNGDSTHLTPIANQLDVSADGSNPFSTVFSHSTLPDGTQLRRWDSSIRQFQFYQYSSSSGTWAAEDGALTADETLSPGDFAYIQNNTGSPFTLTFIGLVRSGSNSSIPGGSVNSYMSSMLPVGGNVQTDPAINLMANFQGNEILALWNGTGFTYYQYAGAGVGTGLGYQSDWIDGSSQPPDAPSIAGDQWDSSDLVYWAPVPRLTAGQGFSIINPNVAELWSQSIDVCSGLTSSSPPALNTGTMSNGNGTFSFNISSGPPGSYWGIYESSDLMNWTLVAGVTLDDSGNSSYSDSSVADVPYRFYKLSNGSTCSQAFGFERMVVGNGDSTHLTPIANQLDVSADGSNPFSTVFSHSTLPDGTQLRRWDSSIRQFQFYQYSSSSGTWAAEDGALTADETLSPGDFAYIQNNTGSPFTLTFIGLVRTAASVSIAGGGAYSYFSSAIPVGGDVGSPAINLMANFQGNESLWLWMGSSFVIYQYAGAGVGTGLGYQSDWIDGSSQPPDAPSIAGDQWDSSDLVYWAPVPALSVGQPFQINNGNLAAESWSQSIDICSEQTSSSPPALNTGAMSNGNGTFSFNISSGPPGSYWNVYQSSDLMNWMLVAGVTLDGSGNNSYSDSSVASVPYRFYKLSNGSTCSQVYGFERVVVGSGDSSHWSPIANQLDVSTGSSDPFSAIFSQTSLPDGTQLKKWDLSIRNFDLYQYSSSSGTWTAESGAPTANETLSPGDFAYIQNNTGSPFTVTFVGLVRTGSNVAIPAGTSFMSSVLPVSGNVQTDPLINLAANFQGQEVLSIWNGSGFTAYTYQGAGVGTGLGYQSDWTDGSGSPPSIPGEQMDTNDELYWMPAPSLTVGQGFEIFNPNTAEQWNQSLDVCQ